MNEQFSALQSRLPWKTNQGGITTFITREAPNDDDSTETQPLKIFEEKRFSFNFYDDDLDIAKYGKSDGIYNKNLEN